MTRVLTNRVVKLEHFRSQRAGIIVHVCDPLRPHACMSIDELVAKSGRKTVHVKTGVPRAQVNQ